MQAENENKFPDCMGEPEPEPIPQWDIEENLNAMLDIHTEMKNKLHIQ